VYAALRSRQSSPKPGSIRQAQRFGVAKHGNRLIPIALKQLDAGCMPRPRTLDWAKSRTSSASRLNKELSRVRRGAGLDAAARTVDRTNLTKGRLL